MFAYANRTVRGVALAALAVAMLIGGPDPRVRDSFERVFAVAVDEQQKAARVTRRRRYRLFRGPHARRPGPARPRRRR